MQRDSIANTFFIATALCVVCSILVSGSAVTLRDRQAANKLREKNKNILKAAGLYDENVHGSADIEQLFEKNVEAMLTSALTGEPYTPPGRSNQESTSTPDAGFTTPLHLRAIPGNQ